MSTQHLSRDSAARGSVIRPRQFVYGLLALLLAGFLAFEAITYGWVAAAVILFFLLAPDLALLGGFRPGLAKGQLAQRNVIPYNLVHSYWTAIALMGLSFFDWPQLWLRSGLEIFLAGLALATHITIDRSFGFRLRTWDGHQRTAFTFA